MEQKPSCDSCLISWRGQTFVIEVKPGATLEDLGKKLQDITNAKPETIRLLVPVDKSAKMLYPFSEEHASLSLVSTSILKGKLVRMMGVLKEEVDDVIQKSNVDHRIAGFMEEERRLKRRGSASSYASIKLPKGTYIFCDFQTLDLPGIELSPPASKALELLHKLASDPGIVAMMNKHRWRVAILTEMAPIGYVGVTPKCILGFNKNHGEEISLRLRTDDLKGFRKYESIKKTLLHELAHMVYSEHDSNFYALDRQLNQEAIALDWTKSRGHTLTKFSHAENNEEDFDIVSNVSSSHKVGGKASSDLPNARSASANAALQRLAITSLSYPRSSEGPSVSGHHNLSGPELNECEGDEPMTLNPPGDLASNETGHIFCGHRMATVQDSQTYPSEENPNMMSPDEVSPTIPTSVVLSSHMDASRQEPRSGRLLAEEVQEPYSTGDMQNLQGFQHDPCNPELQIIQDPVTIFYGRLQSSIQMLKNECQPLETGHVLQTLNKIIRNVVENPDDMKFKKLRKGNPVIQRNIMGYKAAVDILKLIGFSDDIVTDEWGKSEAFLMLKRNDPGLLWLAKSALETHTAPYEIEMN